MKQWLRRYLGINEIQEDQAFLSNKLDGISGQVGNVHTSIGAIMPGLGRIIAKLDPIYGINDDIDDNNRDRRKASDDLGEAVIKRLEGEAQARRHITGEL